MAASDSNHTALKRALMGLGVAAALVVVVLLWSRCATPSTLYSGSVTVDPQQLLGPTNAVAAAERALLEWAPGSEPQLVEVAWRRSGHSMRVAADVDGSIVQVLVEDHGPNGWVVPHPPRPTEGLAPSSWWPLDDPPSAAATDGPLADRGRVPRRLAYGWRYLTVDLHRVPPAGARYLLPGLADHRRRPRVRSGAWHRPGGVGRHDRVRSGHARHCHRPHLAGAPGGRSGRHRPVDDHRSKPMARQLPKRRSGYDGCSRRSTLAVRRLGGHQRWSCG